MIPPEVAVILVTGAWTAACFTLGQMRGHSTAKREAERCIALLERDLRELDRR